MSFTVYYELENQCLFQNVNSLEVLRRMLSYGWRLVNNF